MIYCLPLVTLLSIGAIGLLRGASSPASSTPTIIRYGDIVRLRTHDNDLVVGTKQNDSAWDNFKDGMATFGKGALALGLAGQGAGGMALSYQMAGSISSKPGGLSTKANVSRSNKKAGSEFDTRSLWMMLGKKPIGENVCMGDQISLVCLSRQFGGSNKYSIENAIIPLTTLEAETPLPYGSPVNLKLLDEGGNYGKYLQTYKSKYQGMDWGGAHDASCKIIFEQNPIVTASTTESPKDSPAEPLLYTKQNVFDTWYQDHRMTENSVEWTTDAKEKINIAFSNILNPQIAALRFVLFDTPSSSRIAYGFNNAGGQTFLEVLLSHAHFPEDCYEAGTGITLKIIVSPHGFDVYAKKPSAEASSYQTIFSSHSKGLASNSPAASRRLKMQSGQAAPDTRYLLGLAYNNHSGALPFFAFSNGTGLKQTTVSGVKCAATSKIATAGSPA